MLFNLNWAKVEAKVEVPVTPAPPSLAGLIAWLETQPPETEYDWFNSHGGCLVALYGNAVGIDWEKFHNQLHHEGQLYFAFQTPHTFGAALKRAKALQK